MSVLDRDTILSKTALKRETVEIPEWGGNILVRELTAGERTRYEVGMSDMVQGEQTDPAKKVQRFIDMRARIAAMACLNEDGSRMFRDDDVAALNQLSGNVLDRISTVVLRLSGYTMAEQEKLKKSSLDNGDSTLDLPLH
jgi:hypothetical protein